VPVLLSGAPQQVRYELSCKGVEEDSSPRVHLAEPATTFTETATAERLTGAS
jgi:hypothetical protein